MAGKSQRPIASGVLRAGIARAPKSSQNATKLGNSTVQAQMGRPRPTDYEPRGLTTTATRAQEDRTVSRSWNGFVSGKPVLRRLGGGLPSHQLREVTIGGYRPPLQSAKTLPFLYRGEAFFRRSSFDTNSTGGHQRRHPPSLKLRRDLAGRNRSKFGPKSVQKTVGWTDFPPGMGIEDDQT